MGLDLSIYGTSNYTQDEKGRDTWSVTVLQRFNNFWKMNEILTWKFSNYENCATIDISIDELQEILDELKDNKQEIIDGKVDKWNNETEEHFKSRMINDLQQLNAEIEGLEQFLNSDDLYNFSDLQIHGWW